MTGPTGKTQMTTAPMEPDWVTASSAEPSGMVEWSTQSFSYSKQTKKNEARTEYHRGTVEQLLRYIGTLTLSPALEDLDITIDATQCTIDERPRAGWNDIKHLPDHIGIYWKATYSTPDCSILDENEGTMSSELIDLIAHVAAEHGKCELALGPHDPTPQYMEIGSMF